MKRKSGKTRRPPSDLPTQGGSYIRTPDGSLRPNQPTDATVPPPAVEPAPASLPAKTAK